MAKAKMVRYVAVMDGYDSESVVSLELFVKTTLKGSVDKVETKTVKGVKKTGVGIVIPQKMVKGLVNLAAPCWTMYSKGEVDVAEVDTPKPKAKPKKAEPIEDDSDDEGYGTGDPELEEYLEECEKRGCSYGDIMLLIPSNPTPNVAFANVGYQAFMRDGGVPDGNPRIPNGWNRRAE